MKLVRENIEFKRRQDPKTTLGLGKFHDIPYLRKFHEKILSLGFEDITPKNFPMRSRALVGITYIASYEKGKGKNNIYVEIQQWDDEDLLVGFDDYIIYANGYNESMKEIIGDFINNDNYNTNHIWKKLLSL